MPKKMILLLLGVLWAAPSFAQEESLKIQPADLVQVKVLEAPELQQSARVNDAGDVSLLLGGTVQIGGKTPAEAELIIETALKRGNFVNDPHVSVTVQQYAMSNVTVIGQVRLPGSYPIGTRRTILDVIALAGGLTELADRHITIERRATKERFQYVFSNDATKALGETVDVLPGDQVIVPKASVVYILGDVGRPGGVAMATNDSQLSALQAVAMAGGTPPSAKASRSRLIRKQSDGTYIEMDLPLADMQKGKVHDIALKPDDIIWVPFSYLKNAATNLNSLLVAASTAAIYRF